MRARKLVERADERYMRLLRAYKMRPMQIARRCKVSVATVYRGLERERAREAEARRAATANTTRGPSLTLAFGSSCKPLALLRCDDVHPNGPIPEGSRCCCAACHGTGIEGHPAFRIDALPPPEKRTQAKAEPKPNRKQRRAARRMQHAGAA